MEIAGLHVAVQRILSNYKIQVRRNWLYIVRRQIFSMIGS